MNITKVLVAIDESENSDRALKFALGLSEKFEAAITILNVSESLAINPNAAETMSSSTASMAEVAKDISKIHENFLSKAVAKAKSEKSSLEISSIQKQGDTAIEIVQTAKDGGFEIIVVGHRGQGKRRVQEFLMGSISEKVAHLAPCPVVIVK
jgi:nucleotide-binding universal stress UspA family protein